jgi:hypothetical protein
MSLLNLNDEVFMAKGGNNSKINKWTQKANIFRIIVSIPKFDQLSKVV